MWIGCGFDCVHFSAAKKPCEGQGYFSWIENPASVHVHLLCIVCMVTIMVAVLQSDWAG